MVLTPPTATMISWNMSLSIYLNSLHYQPINKLTKTKNKPKPKQTQNQNTFLKWRFLAGLWLYGLFVHLCIPCLNTYWGIFFNSRKISSFSLCIFSCVLGLECSSHLSLPGEQLFTLEHSDIFRDSSLVLHSSIGLTPSSVHMSIF